MINDDNKIEIIDQYLEGTLTGELLQEVEERMKTDQEFRQEVAMQESIIQEIREIERESLRQEIAELFEENNPFARQEASTVAISRRSRYYGAAAIITLAVVAGLVWMLNRPSATEVYRGYVALEEASGMRDPFVHSDSLAVKIVQHHGEYKFHYQWQDTLVLYGSFALDTLLVQYDAPDDLYILHIGQQEYPIRHSATVQPLQP